MRDRADRELGSLPEPTEDQASVLQAVLNSTPTQLAYLDSQLNFVWVNDAYARGSGYAREELISRNHFELFPNPENQAIFEKVRDTGEPFTVRAKPFEYANQPERGVTYWDWTLAPINEVNGEVTGLALSLQDVTGQVRAEKESEKHIASLDALIAQLDTTISAIADGVVIYNRSGEISRMNRTAERMLGYAPADAKLPFADRAALLQVTAVDGQPFSSAEELPARRALRGETVYNVTMALRNPQTKQQFWVSASAAPIWASDRSLLGAVASFTDITELHRARDELERQVQERTAELAEAVEALRESEQRLRYAFEYAPFGMALIGTDGRFLQVNLALCELFGYSEEELPGKTLAELAFADDLPVWQDLFAGLLEGRRDHGWIENRYIRRDGRAIWAHLSTNMAHDSDGVPLYLVSQIQDITERKREEHALRQQAQIIDQIHDAVIATDLDGYVISWNQGAERLTGYAVAEALGKHISYLYPDDQHAYLEDEVIKPLKAKGVHETRVRMRSKSGQDLYAHLSLSLLRDRAGAAVGMIGYSMDITERQRAEQRVQRQIERLKVLQEMHLAILNAHSSAETAVAVMNHLRELVQRCSGANLVLFDLENQRGTVLAVDAGRQTEFGSGKHLPLELAGDLQDLRQEKIYLVDDVQTIPQPSPTLRAMIAGGLRSYMCVPLVVEGNLVGSLNLRSDLPRAFTREDVEIAREVAGPLAIVIQQARLSEELRDSNERLRLLSRRLVDAQEKERRRLARELHDEIGQAMTAIKISLQTAQRRAQNGVTEPQLEESIAIVDRALRQVRDVSLDLRPSLLDDLGLVATLRWYLDRHTQSGGCKASLQVSPLDLRLPSELEIVFFRVVQEALTNVTRHARAQNVHVNLLLHEEAVELTVRDDGVGFDVQDALESAMAGTSMGLLGMQERVRLAGGEIDIISTPERGTEIRAKFAVTQ